ncbi:MAG: FAD binding domain-containing protein [Desulfarculus sp.]|nr:FAD binding domain-containing protein [Desulfarculus sp.]
MSPEYLTPASLPEACAALAQAGPTGRVMAGGTDLMVELRARRLAGLEPSGLLVDVAGLPELQGARLENGELWLGAALTFSQCQDHPLIREHLPLLAEAARRVGSLQIRNVATLGGNLGNRSAAADGVTVLAALGAVARVASAAGQRQALVEHLAGQGLAPGEIIVGFALPAPASPTAAAFAKVIRRQAVGIARFNLAAQLTLEGDGQIAAAGIAVGAVFPSPRRVPEAEALLLGRRPSPEMWEQAAQAISDDMLRACGERPSMVYKEPALARVAASALELAWRRGLANPGRRP